jgi:hypothetical protein
VADGISRSDESGWRWQKEVEDAADFRSISGFFTLLRLLKNFENVVGGNNFEGWCIRKSCLRNLKVVVAWKFGRGAGNDKVTARADARRAFFNGDGAHRASPQLEAFDEKAPFFRGH